MISVSYKGTLSRHFKTLSRLKGGKYIIDDFDRYGREGVDILSKATPKKSGETARSWEYKVERSATGATISWYNTHEINGVNIAVIIQYGHGTGTGGYVPAIDYVNPSMQPFLNKAAIEIWKKVSNG